MDDREPTTQGETGAPQGRRLAEKKGLSKRGKIAVTIVAVVAALLLGSYLGLCAYAAGDRVLPGTCMGDVDLSGLTAEEAGEKIELVSKEQYDALSIPIYVGSETVNFSAREAEVKSAGDGQAAVRAGKEHFLANGWNFLAGVLGRETQVPCQVTVGNMDYLTRTLEQVSAAVDQPVEDPHWELEETDNTAQAVLYRGRTGQRVDQQAVYEDLMTALARRGGSVTAQVSMTAPAQPDFAAMKSDIDREPENATLDVETDEIVPHKLGLTVDIDEAQSLFAGLSEGESARLPLETQTPEVTTLDLRAGLFRDVLGEGSSKISGDANRVGNVKLAAAACNGVILLPGEKMSYNQTTGQRTAAKGYRTASGYTAKGIEDMVGGGVCQPSSTLYLACLNANLEIVERSNHRYTVSYMPEGMDATVSWPNLDYVFANNTPYPIKVETGVEDRVLTVRIYGTKTDDTYVKMESVRLSTTPAGVTYEPDETVPVGTTRVLQGAHTGKKVQVYKNVYSGDGTLLSRTLVSTDTYRPGNQIVAYNPADGAPDGSVPPTVSDDPTAGWAIDPATGWPIDPETGVAVDPATVLPSADPVQPDDPAQPAEPVEPTQPAEPAEPAEPTQPAEPDRPVEPPSAEPAQSGTEDPVQTEAPVPPPEGIPAE